MSTTQSPVQRGSTGGGERSHSHVDLVPLTADFNKMLTKSSARFGALSHHSFFSRHNPHPNRVRHIQALFSEAWRDELKELVANLNLSSQAQKDKREEMQEGGLVRRQTQYSTESGRIIPPSSRSLHRKSYSQHPKYPQPFQDQELTVLEVLCQILQTDSLSTVQQWLLLAGQREKDLVMKMIRQALGGVDLSGRNLQPFQAYHPGTSVPVCGSSSRQPWRRARKTSSSNVDSSFCKDKPERIGDAEVLEVHTATPDPLQHTHTDHA